MSFLQKRLVIWSKPDISTKHVPKSSNVLQNKCGQELRWNGVSNTNIYVVNSDDVVFPSRHHNFDYRVKEDIIII